MNFQISLFSNFQIPQIPQIFKLAHFQISQIKHYAKRQGKYYCNKKF